MSCYTTDVFGPEIGASTDSNSHNYKFYLICAFVVTKTLTLYIDWRQLLKYCELTVHPYLKSVVKTGDFNSSQQYNFEKHSFGMVHECFESAVELFFIYNLTHATWWKMLDGFQTNIGLC